MEELKNAAYQHRVLKEMVEDSMDLQYLQNGRLSPDRVQVALQVAEEAKMERLAVDEVWVMPVAEMEQKASEVLQTRTVGLEEVKADLARWKPAFQKEYDNLVRGPVTITAGQSEQIAEGIPMDTVYPERRWL